MNKPKPHEKYSHLYKQKDVQDFLKWFNFYFVNDNERYQCEKIETQYEDGSLFGKKGLGYVSICDNGFYASPKQFFDMYYSLKESKKLKEL